MASISVGASFSYINPASVGGAAPQVTKASDAEASESPATPSAERSESASETSEPKSTTAAQPKFSSDAQAALIHVQEHDRAPTATAKSYPGSAGMVVA